MLVFLPIHNRANPHEIISHSSHTFTRPITLESLFYTIERSAGRLDTSITQQLTRL
jgi:hypothetical protein